MHASACVVTAGAWVARDGRVRCPRQQNLAPGQLARRSRYRARVRLGRASTPPARENDRTCWVYKRWVRWWCYCSGWVVALILHGRVCPSSVVVLPFPFSPYAPSIHFIPKDMLKTKNQSFLDVDPADYPELTAILLDPSCSGSGIIKRWDSLVDDDHDHEEVEEQKVGTLAGGSDGDAGGKANKNNSKNNCYNSKNTSIYSNNNKYIYILYQN